jgi:hypothetical protein
VSAQVVGVLVILKLTVAGLALCCAAAVATLWLEAHRRRQRLAHDRAQVELARRAHDRVEADYVRTSYAQRRAS